MSNGSGTPGIYMEPKTITAPNVIPPLLFVPNGNVFLLIVNGRTFTLVDQPPAFTVSGQVITWSSAIYGLNPGDDVVAVYSGSPPPSPPIPPATPSGTTNFFPSLGECTLNALSRIRIRGPLVLAEHLHQAWMEANLMQVEWSNRGPNLWKVSEQIIQTVPGVATYQIPSTVIMVLNVTIGLGDPPNENELTITPMTRQEYTMQPNKANQARPTSFWFDRLIAPTVTLWPTPDQVYNMHVWSFGQQFDAILRGGTLLDVPYRWLDAASAGLASRLAVHYAQDLEQQRKAQSDEAYRYAATQDTEDGSVYLLPMVQNYYD
jgi:hypothetical protein